VAALASGPGANLVTGVIEQNELFHVMGRALGLIPAPAAD
jgi:alkaline phosphatase